MPLLLPVVWHYWQGYGLAIQRSQVWVLTGHHCVVTSGKLREPVCFFVFIML